MNPLLKVSLCNRRTNRKYKNQEKPWSWLKDRNRIPIRTTETVEEYPRLSKEERDDLKDQGGFVGGWLREGLRKNGNVLCRTIGALDADNIPGDTDFPALVRKALPGVEWFLYSTHKHTPQAPRYRLVILLDREVSEEEYPPLMRQVAKDIGMDYFDDSTYQANRMMYWASCPSDGVFVFDESSGRALATDTYLARYENWKDASQWPTSSRQSEAERQAAERQKDPLEKDGVVGAFCRTYYPVETALETFLSDIYQPTGIEGRWDYVPADSTAGVVIYDGRFVYSHHTTDPACGKLLNAFDIVRIHRFGNDETKKSFQEMAEFALEQEEVKLLLDKERMERVTDDFGDEEETDRTWVSQLTYNPRSGEVENTSQNLLLILRNDPACAFFALNEMAGKIQLTGEAPWVRPQGNIWWRNADDAQLRAWVDEHYGAFSERNYTVAFTKAAEDRVFHPVRDYLDGLPAWDGVSRIETILIQCLQADDTPYVRAVTRKLMAAAVARIYVPGIKFDSVLVLDGAQGIGKSSVFRMLAGESYYSETLSLTDMNDKSGSEKLQGMWFVEIGELAGMRKADIEKVKAFLSTTDDQYRAAYGHWVESHPRSCVIVATVNGERGYLRDITGNRRFWIVKCRQTESKRIFSFTEKERDQIWAEAKHLWEQDEPLWLEGDLLKAAEEAAQDAMEADDRLGIVEEYLETLLPEKWEEMDLFERRQFLNGRSDPVMPRGSVRRKRVSNAEIWTECFSRDLSDMKPADSYALAALMVRVKNWKRTDKTVRVPIYGRQRIYERATEDDVPDCLR